MPSTARFSHALRAITTSMKFGGKARDSKIGHTTPTPMIFRRVRHQRGFKQAGSGMLRMQHGQHSG